MFNLPYAGTHLNTNSSPFPAYLQQDALYIGDDSGVLWKIAGVFNGTPALATGWTSGFTDPAGASVLTGPIFDNGSSHIFVADSAGRA